MLDKPSYNLNQLRDYSSLFSRSQALLWLKSDFTSINYKIERYDEKWGNSVCATYIDYLKYVYHILEMHYQNEYVFKNAFLNDWIIEEIGKDNTKIFNEFRVGNAVADLALFNGNSTVFEIKTEFDSTSRLTLQLENYHKAFNQVFIIIPEPKLSLYRKFDKKVGIITFNKSHTQNFEIQRVAVFNSVVDADTIMHILHTHEYKAIVKSFYGQLPAMTSFNQFRKCRDLIKEIPNHELNKNFIDQMKKREVENELSSRYYKELNQLSLALRLSKTEKDTLINNLKSPLKV